MSGSAGAERGPGVLAWRACPEGTSEVDMGPLQNIWAIISLPDNIPIVLMLGLVGYFIRLSFREAGKHDRLIAEGRKDDVLKAMQD